MGRTGSNDFYNQFSRLLQGRFRTETPEKTRFKESTTKVAKPFTQPVNATFSTLQNRQTFKSLTQGTI